MASLSTEECEGEELVVSLFEIRREDLPALVEREHEFRFIDVLPIEDKTIFDDEQAENCKYLLLLSLSLSHTHTHNTKRFCYSGNEHQSYHVRSL